MINFPLNEVSIPFPKRKFDIAMSRYPKLICPPPIHWTIELTKNCNLKCIYCPRNSFGNDEAEMRKIYIEPDFLKCLSYELSFADIITLCGFGEIFLHDRLFYIMDIIRSINKTCNFTMPTNGTIPITEEQILKMSEHQVYLSISLDNTDPTINEKTRVGSNTKKILENIKFIADIKRKYNLDFPAITILSVITKGQLGQMRNMVDFCLENRMIALRMVNLYFDWDENNEVNKDFLITDEADIQKYNNELDEVSEYLLKVKPDPFYFGARYMTVNKNNFVCNTDPNADRIKNHPCLDPWIFCQVFSQGQFVECGHSPSVVGIINPSKSKTPEEIFKDTIAALPSKASDEEYKILNESLTHGCLSFQQAWNGPKMIKLRNQIRTNKLNDYCDSCVKQDLHNTWFLCT